VKLSVRDALHHAYADYTSWLESERWELIGGVAYAMVPAPSRLRQEVVLEFARQIEDALLSKACRA
jgi:hypothetical protein